MTDSHPQWLEDEHQNITKWNNKMFVSGISLRMLEENGITEGGQKDFFGISRISGRKIITPL